MDTLEVSTGHVAVVFLPSGEFRSYTISHDHWTAADDPRHLPVGDVDTRAQLGCSACKDIAFMRTEAEMFWLMLQDDEPPPVDGLQVTTDALQFLHANAIKGKRAEIGWQLAALYTDACDAFKAAELDKDEAANFLRQRMGDATLAVDPDGRVIARREVFKRAGYEVGPCEVDRLVRVKPKEGKTDANLV